MAHVLCAIVTWLDTKQISINLKLAVSCHFNLAKVERLELLAELLWEYEPYRKGDHELASVVQR